MTTKQAATLTPRKLDQLRMLADWQLRQLGYEPEEVTRLCLEQDTQNSK